MTSDTPRGLQFLRAAIADLEDLGELARVRAFARERWGDDAGFYREIEALLDRRQAELEGLADAQLRLALEDDNETYEGLDRDAG